MYTKDYDVIVIGSGPGGLPAAIAARRKGLTTLLVERSAQLGGLLVSGLPALGYIDRSGRQVVGGIAQELIDRLLAVGGTIGHIKVPIHNSLTPINASWMRVIAFEMCEQAGIDVLLYSELMHVTVDNGKVKGIRVLCRGEVLSFHTSIIIDATGDACAAFFAGAEYEKGDASGSNMQPPSLTFELGNVNFEEVLEYLRNNPSEYDLPEKFHGIEQTMQFFENNKCFPIMGFYQCIERARANGDFDIPRNMIDFVRGMYPGQAFVNITRATETDLTDFESVNKAELICHRQVKQAVLFFQKYMPGFQNSHLIAMEPWLGGRESRRIVGRYQMTRASIAENGIPMDSIAIAGYNIDIHSSNNGQMTMIPIERGVGIPYGCLIPRTIEGLIMSGRTISVDQEVFGLIRVMSTCMAVGEAAGMAAAIAYQTGVLPSQIDVQQLRIELRKAGAIVD